MARATPLKAGPADNAEIVAMLAPGDIIEVLDLAHGQAWGKAPGHGLAGYAARADLEPVVPERP
ncbi:hypothetical protein [Sphingomonas sp.]|uniref:hypothetical protein n=1 Tax=Sphingomonas sp. TaxID=28214 RepID=UPI0025DF2DF1|nr:hypothetical protein [Sphingomonas sp.]